MAVKFLDNTGLGYFWGKIKTWCSSTFAVIAHTHSSTSLENVKHSYTTAANAAKNWYRIANANTSQIDTSKPLHVQFMLTAYNTTVNNDYYQRWFVDCEVFGRNSGLRVFGNSQIPLSYVRLLYENTNADVDSSDRPAIDVYLNYVIASATSIEIEEIHNSGWTFIPNGQLSVSTVLTGFESRQATCYASGVSNCNAADFATYHYLYSYNISANTTLSSSNSNHRYRILNCTGTITLTVPSWNSSSGWFFINNNGTGIVTVHPVSTSVMFNNVSADIILQPGEFVRLACQSNNHYSIIDDGRWKSQKADKGTTLSDYGITDAKIANGTITLGSNSITPLTSHQILPTLSRTISGSGNAITDITVSDYAITATKGNTFLTSASTLDATKLSGTIPSGCYTNTTYTAGTGLSLSGTQFSLASHNQASDTINLLTGYSKVVIWR